MYLHIAILCSMCTYVTVSIAVHIVALPICLSYSSVCFLIRVRLVYVYSNSHTHTPPSSRKFMFASKSTSTSPPSCIYFHSGKNIYFPAFTYTYPPLSSGLGMYLPILICRYLPMLATLRTHSIHVHTYSEAYS